MRFRVVGLTFAVVLCHAVAVLGQIVDRPPTQPRPQSHWGVRASFTPRWWTPDPWGKLFFESVVRTRFRRRMAEHGVVRGRPSASSSASR